MMYASCPQLEKPGRVESPEEVAVRQLTDKYDSYRGLMQASRRRVSSVDGSDTISSSGDSSKLEEVTEHERLQIETFFKGLKTQVFVCGSLANLYVGHVSTPGQWDLSQVGVPVLLLDSGDTRSRRGRRIQLLLAERGTCFTLWRETIDNLSSYRESGPAFHTLHTSADHSRLAGLSFDSELAARQLWTRMEHLTSDPENISLSVPGRRRRGNMGARSGAAQQKPLPAKTHISLPCCFQHITSVEAGDRERFASLRSLVAPQPTAIHPATEL